MKEQRGKEDVEIMTGEEGKGKKMDAENYSGSGFDRRVVEEVRGS